MATVNNQDEQNPNQPNQQPITGGTSASGSGTGKGVGTAQASQVQQNQAPQNGQGYTDVASYLNANPQGGQELGSKIASNLNTGYQNTQNAINQSVNQANTAIGQGYTPENTQLIQQVAANPTAAAADQNQLAGFQAQLNDTYSGPTSWADYGTQQGNVQTAQQKAGLTKTPGGNNVLIQEVENQMNPGQTGTGINTLDTLLYQGNPNAVNQAQTAANQYNDLGNYLNTQNAAINTGISGAQNAAQNASQHALDAFTGANGTLTNLNTAVNQQAADQTAQQTAAQKSAQDALANLYGGVAQRTATAYIPGYGGTQNPYADWGNYNVGDLNAQQLGALGMSEDQWGTLQNALKQAATTRVDRSQGLGVFTPTAQVDLSQYLNSINPQAISAANAATPEQYAQTAAIQKLLGGQLPQGTVLNPQMANLAGTTPSMQGQFNYQGALDAANQLIQQENKMSQDETKALDAQAAAGHAASKHGGLLSSLTNPVNIIGTAINPASWLPNALSAIQNKPISGTNIDPIAALGK